MRVQTSIILAGHERKELHRICGRVVQQLEKDYKASEPGSEERRNTGFLLRDFANQVAKIFEE